MLAIMTGNIETRRMAAVIDLVAFRAEGGHAGPRVHQVERLLAARRLPTAREIAHRRRMLEHLATTGEIAAWR